MPVRHSSALARLQLGCRFFYISARHLQLSRGHLFRRLHAFATRDRGHSDLIPIPVSRTLPWPLQTTTSALPRSFSLHSQLLRVDNASSSISSSSLVTATYSALQHPPCQSHHHRPRPTRRGSPSSARIRRRLATPTPTQATRRRAWRRARARRTAGGRLTPPRRRSTRTATPRRSTQSPTAASRSPPPQTHPTRTTRSWPTSRTPTRTCPSPTRWATRASGVHHIPSRLTMSPPAHDPCPLLPSRFPPFRRLGQATGAGTHSTRCARRTWGGPSLATSGNIRG